MPIAMDKDTRFVYVLQTDRAKETNKPTFYFSALTMAAWRKMNQRAKQIDDCKNVEDALAELCSMITAHLVGWENMTNPATGQPLKFNKNKLADLITMNEAWELIAGIKDQGVEANDLKN